jgi:hypothetical protein
MSIPTLSTKTAGTQNLQEMDRKKSDRALQQSHIVPSESSVLGDLPNTCLEKIHRAVYRATCRTIFGCDLRVWYGILLELRSLIGRIGILRKRKLYRYGIDLGPGKELGANGHAMACKRTEARMNSIRYLLSIHPLASPVDLHLHLEGWDKGEQYIRSESAHGADACSK